MFFELHNNNINDQGITEVYDVVMVGKIVRIIDQVNDQAMLGIGLNYWTN